MTAFGIILRKATLRRMLNVAAALIATAIGVAGIRNRGALTADERTLVGTWVHDQYTFPKRVMTLDSNRSVHVRDVNEAGSTVAEVIGDKNECWYVDENCLFIRRGKKGQPALTERLTGRSHWWDEWHIVLESGDTLVMEGSPFGQIWKRASTHSSGSP
jgi:hypothetical protein